MKLTFYWLISIYAAFLCYVFLVEEPRESKAPRSEAEIRIPTEAPQVKAPKAKEVHISRFKVSESAMEWSLQNNPRQVYRTGPDTVRYGPSNCYLTPEGEWDCETVNVR